MTLQADVRGTDPKFASPAANDLERQVAHHLRRHLAGGGESSLRSAYELGRTARAGEVGIREMGASLFRAAFQILADDGAPIAQRGADVEAFVMEALSPFDVQPASPSDAVTTPVNGEAARPDPLSPREREVLQRIADGFTNKEIARMLGISVKTVETHRGSLMRKLDIHATAGLVRYAIRRGLTDP